MIGSPLDLIGPELITAALVGVAIAALPRRDSALLTLALIGLLLWEPKVLQQLESVIAPSSSFRFAESEKPENAEATWLALRMKADENGHFYLMPKINGVPVRVMVDTGATAVSLSYEDAERLRLKPRLLNYNVRTRTANGETWAARVKLADVRIGAIHVQDIDALVAMKGALPTSLLGMTFLKRVRLRIERGELALYQ